jgi:hypothetical protein
VWVATPPYRFWNPRYVDISYGISAKESISTSPRDFAFVTNEADYKIASDAVDTVLWPYNYTKKEVDEAMTKLDTMHKKRGTFTITDASLKSGADGKDEIEGLSFKVELDSTL